MRHEALQTLIFALNAGIFSLLLSNFLRIPSIILYLLAGILLGPFMAGWILPESIGPVLTVMIEAAVAVIVFEGAMNLDLSQFRKASQIIQRIATTGALVTIIGTTLLCHFLMHLPWNLSLIFGCIMMITGPTVVTPILRRVPLKEPLASILHWESILLEPIGVVLALLILELVLVSEVTLLLTIGNFLMILFVGTVCGVVYASLFSLWLKKWSLSQDGVRNLVVLGSALLVFQIANLIIPNSGLVAVVAGGLVLSRSKIPGLEEIKQFKETITLLLISTIFVLLASKLNLHLLFSGGKQVILFLVLTIFVVRPLAIFLSTSKSELNKRSKIFLSLIGPRGIVSASLISLIAILLQQKGMTEAARLEILAYQLIGTTVILQGLLAPVLAMILGVRQKEKKGYLIIGAHLLARRVAKWMNEKGVSTLLIDRDFFEVRQAQKEGLRALKGDALDQRFLDGLDLHSIGRLMALTPNDEVNTLACQVGHRVFGKGKCYQISHQTVNKENEEHFISDAGGILFGQGTKKLDILLTELDWDRYELKEATVPLPEGFIPLVISPAGGEVKAITDEGSLKNDQAIFGLMPKASEA